jgi:hypothetical protein
LRVVAGRARTRCVARTGPLASLGASAKQSRAARPGIWIASSLSAPRNDAATDVSRERVSTSSLPGLTRASVRRARESEFQSRRSSHRSPADSMWPNSGANASREQSRPARRCCCAIGRNGGASDHRTRPTVKQLSSFSDLDGWSRGHRLLARGRRRSQNVHRPCLYVYTRTAISRMRRSARVQRRRANFCSIRLGSNCGTFTCASSAH